MSKLLVSHQPSDNEQFPRATEKGAMSSPGSRSAPATQRNRTPTNHSARSSNHGDNASNAGEDGSARSRTLASSGRRPFGKSSVSPVSQKRLSAGVPATSLVRSENQYAMKKKRFLLLKKEMLEKQKTAQDLYNDMAQLHEKLSAGGARDLAKPEAFRIVVGSPKAPASNRSCDENEQSVVRMEKLAVGKELLATLESRLREIPRMSQNLCRELLVEKQRAFVASHPSKAGEEEAETCSLNREPTFHQEEEEEEEDHRLRYRRNEDTVGSDRLAEIEELEERSIAELMKSVASMIEEFEESRVKLMEQNATDAHGDLRVQLRTAAEELQAEKERNMQAKDRLRQTETQLQKARARIRELEARVENDEGKIQQLQATIKSLEGQLKQRETTMDGKLKDMQKVLKNSEGMRAMVEKQRDSFEARLVELKEEMSSKKNDEMMRINELSERLTAATNEIGVEREKRLQVEDAFSELEDRYKKLEEKSKQLCELAEKNKDFMIIEGNHTENEMRLFNDLQTARDELEAQRRAILQLQQDKEEIVAVMHQAASREEDKDCREKLAAELVIKSTEMQNLMMECAELKKIAKNAQEKNGNLERQLVEIQTRLHSQSMEGGNAALTAHAIELQQELSDLRNNLAEAIQQKEELETALTQKQLEIEQRDHVMREQSKFLKARDELLDFLKGKVQENGELSNSDENNEYLEQIAAKTEALQELYTTLKNKQLQIMHLEKMVKLMEVQQDRAQAQRTRLENRIAQLELTLHRSKEPRSKGFGIL